MEGGLEKGYICNIVKDRSWRRAMYSKVYRLFH
jgi:hypothetical protein